MWKKIFAASLLASVSSVLFLGSQSASAAITAPAPYDPGDWIGYYSGNITVCASGSDHYSLSETPITADIQAENLSTQLVFDGSNSCRRFENINLFQIRYFSPIGVHGDLLIEVSTLNGESNIAVTVARNEPVDKYLWMASSSRQSFEGASAVISFDANGGSGALPEIIVAEAGSSVTLPRNTLTREGYRFAGWNTKANGTGTPYADEATISIEELGQTQLFAQWQGRAVLDSGYNVNIKLKNLASAYGDGSASIKAIKTANALPAGFNVDNDANIISVRGSYSREPIYAWLDDSDSDNDGVGDGVIYLYTNANRIESGSNMSAMFRDIASLSDISALASWDTSGATKMGAMFHGTKITNVDALETKQHEGKDYVSWNTSNVTLMSGVFDGATSLRDISALASWNTSGVENMTYMFSSATSLRDISALASWDTSDVENMASMFSDATSLSDISALASWNTSKVKDFDDMFYNTRITNADALETKQHEGKDYVSWNTSSATDMSGMFYGATSLRDISALASWDTSNVTDFGAMFNNTRITNIDALETKQHEGKDYVSWNTSSATYMNAMFCEATSLSDISALASWNTSNVTLMGAMFANATSLSDISALASWNTSKVKDFGVMFYNTQITNVDALETKQHEGKDYVSWNTSSATDMSFMFAGVASLVDVSALASWDTSNVTGMSGMFDGVPARPLPTWYHE
ncbi:BspA family leucine-rich repeat surface protein [Candidatus Saccharibacteria bacterium]|nr:BspA family leucine-rich repeat surface protein [Candidatus Saccharibacteria bacterium]